MMKAVAVANQFIDLVRRSKLVEDDPLGKFVTELSKNSGGKLPKSDEKIAAALVKQELLTRWQVDKLLAGKHKGFMLGKYKLLSHLGKGGMSQVYLAEHTLMKRKVAIKVLPANRVEDSTYLERFRIEARAAAKLDDPNIVRAYDIDQDGKTHYLVMEYVNGKDLHVLVKDDGPLGYNRAADYIAQVALGLHHAHDMGLIHRDIKPANCLLDGKGTVKLLDMGLARLVGDEASLTLDNNENVLGTADYLPPEQALNSHTADQRADIYSLGCTLYFLLTGHPPFPDGTISERLLKHQVEQAPSIFKDRPEAPPGLVNICIRMMAKKPQDRYQTAGDVAQRLYDWLSDRGYKADSGSQKSGPGSGDGVGSDVFRRFAASLDRTGSASSSNIGSGGGLSNVISKGDSKGSVSGNKSGDSLNQRLEFSNQDDEDIGLAPLDEELESKQSKSKDKPGATGKSGIKGDSANGTIASDSTASDTSVEGPLRSLIEEQLEAGRLGENEAELELMRHRAEHYNTLYPTGRVTSSSGPSPWIFVGAVLGFCLLVWLVWYVTK
jgi:serine/threonine protein kinase